MVSKLYFEETFSLATAQALQEWANNNLIVQGLGDYGMRISYLGAGEMFAETEITGLTIDNEYTLSTETIEVSANRYRTKINALPNDNASNVAELGYGTGKRTLLFTATAETMYIAIGDETGGSGVYSIVDNVSLKIDGVEAVSNGTFEGNNTTGWYAQSGNATLSVYSYVATPILDNPYLEEVNIPLYDAGNPAHCLIPTDAPWNATTLNNTTWTNFYIEAGDYSGKPEIYASGTAAVPRTITLYEGSDTHPAQLATGQQARIAFKFTNASYWTVSRTSGNPALQYTGTWAETGLYQIDRNCSNIILDSIYFENCWDPIAIRKLTYNNTIQKCFFDGVNEGMYSIDSAFIQLQDGANENEYAETLNTKIILNDFKNYKPLRLQNSANIPWSKDFAGTTVDSNSVWWDDTQYTNADGTPNTNGIYCKGEASWGGIKAGSNDISNPVIVSNNTVQGGKPTYPSAPSALRSNKSSLATVYYFCKYVHQYGNVANDMAGGLLLTSGDGTRQVFESNAEHNILYQCGGQPEHDEEQTRPMRHETTDTCMVRNNIIKDAVGKWARLNSLNGYNNYFGLNDCINSDFTYITSGSDSVDGLATNNDMTTAQGDTKYLYDYTMTTHRYTVTPETIVIPNVLQVEQEDFIQSIWDMS